MLTVMALAGAALLSAPMPIDPVKQPTRADYPAEAAETHEEGSTIFLLTVSPSGEPINCAIEASSGSNLLDYRTCKLVRSRAHFTPAHDRSGAPIVGTYRDEWRWHLDSDSIRVHDMDQVGVTVSRLPAGLGSHAAVDAAILVDEQGHVTDCSVDSAPGQGRLGDMACQQARTTWHARPAHDLARKAVPSVQTVRVGFSTAAASSK